MRRQFTDRVGRVSSDYPSRPAEGTPSRRTADVSNRASREGWGEELGSSRETSAFGALSGGAIGTGRGIVLQRKCACGGSGAAGECETCNKKKLQRKGEGAGPSSIPESVHRTIGRSGSPLPVGTRNMFEAALGHDFSGVRIHADASGAESARDVNARAYTVGPNVVFGAGEYHPETREGRRLLAHELTHVVQQSGSGGMLQRQPDGEGGESDELEREADGAAELMPDDPAPDGDPEIGSTWNTEVPSVEVGNQTAQVDASIVQLPDPSDTKRREEAQACVLELHGEETEAMATALELVQTRPVNLVMILRNPRNYTVDNLESLRLIRINVKTTKKTTRRGRTTTNVVESRCYADPNRIFPTDVGGADLNTTKAFVGGCSSEASNKAAHAAVKQFASHVMAAISAARGIRMSMKGALDLPATRTEEKGGKPILSLHNNGIGEGNVSVADWDTYSDFATSKHARNAEENKITTDEVLLVTRLKTYNLFAGFGLLDLMKSVLGAQADTLFSDLESIRKKKETENARTGKGIHIVGDADYARVKEIAASFIEKLDAKEISPDLDDARRAEVRSRVLVLLGVYDKFNLYLQAVYAKDDEAVRKEIGRSSLKWDGSSSMRYRESDFINLEVGSNRGSDPAIFKKNFGLADEILQTLGVLGVRNPDASMADAIAEIRRKYTWREGEASLIPSK